MRKKMTERERKLYLTARSVSKFLVAQTNVDETYLRAMLYRVVSILEGASSIAAITDIEIERDIAKKEHVCAYHNCKNTAVFFGYCENHMTDFSTDL